MRPCADEDPFLEMVFAAGEGSERKVQIRR